MTPNSEGGEAVVGAPVPPTPAAIRSVDSIPTRVYFADGGGMTVPPFLTLKTRLGRIYRFTWHPYMGPTFERKDGEPRHHFPSQRNPMWSDFTLWDHQGRLVDEHGNCVWDAKAPQQEAAIRKAEGGGV